MCLAGHVRWDRWGEVVPTTCGEVRFVATVGIRLVRSSPSSEHHFDRGQHVFSVVSSPKRGRRRGLPGRAAVPESIVFENQSFRKGVGHADQLASGHRQMFLLHHFAEPFKLWVGLWVEDFDVRLRNRLSSISQDPQNPARLLRLKNANVATTKDIKLAKAGWLAAYDLKRRTRCPRAYRPCCFVI